MSEEMHNKIVTDPQIDHAMGPSACPCKFSSALISLFFSVDRKRMSPTPPHLRSPLVLLQPIQQYVSINGGSFVSLIHAFQQPRTYLNFLPVSISFHISLFQSPCIFINHMLTRSFLFMYFLPCCLQHSVLASLSTSSSPTGCEVCSYVCTHFDVEINAVPFKYVPIVCFFFVGLSC